MFEVSAELSFNDDEIGTRDPWHGGFQLLVQLTKSPFYRFALGWISRYIGPICPITERRVDSHGEADS